MSGGRDPGLALPAPHGGDRRLPRRKTVRDAPASFASFSAGGRRAHAGTDPGAPRGPLRLGPVAGEGRSTTGKPSPSLPLGGGGRPLPRRPRAPRRVPASEKPLRQRPEKLFQGPIADALTHVGQIAILRRLAGSPLRGENYFKADIAAGRVGQDQPASRVEFD